MRTRGTEEELPPWSHEEGIVAAAGRHAGRGRSWRSSWCTPSRRPSPAFGFTHTFVGVIIIAIVGNAAEHSTAIIMALKNKMDLAFNIAFESSKQIALFVAPVLVLVSDPAGAAPDAGVQPHGGAGHGLGVGAATLIALDGESNWLEGVMLLGVYAILGVAFFFIP